MSKKSKTEIVIDANKLDEFIDKMEAAKDNLRLTHATFADGTCTYSYSKLLANGDTDIITNNCGRQYHNDLRKAFRTFDSHLAVITEQVDADDVRDIDEHEGSTDEITEKLNQVEVNDIKVFGNIETGSIILSGRKILKTNDEIKLKTPKVALESDYVFTNELAAAVQELISEITAYHNGKSRPEQQMELFDEEENK